MRALAGLAEVRWVRARPRSGRRPNVRAAADRMRTLVPHSASEASPGTRVRDSGPPTGPAHAGHAPTSRTLQEGIGRTRTILTRKDSPTFSVGDARSSPGHAVSRRAWHPSSWHQGVNYGLARPFRAWRVRVCSKPGGALPRAGMGRAVGARGSKAGHSLFESSGHGTRWIPDGFHPV